MSAPEQVVWKFPLQLTDTIQSLEVPGVGQLAHIAWFQGRPTLWFLVDPAAAPSRRSFTVAATGQPMPPAHTARHHGSVIQENTFVWHIFELFIPADPMDAPAPVNAP